MSICKACGKTHWMVLENMETNDRESIDWCEECFFTVGYTYKEPEKISIDEFPPKNYGM